MCMHNSFMLLPTVRFYAITANLAKYILLSLHITTCVYSNEDYQNDGNCVVKTELCILKSIPLYL